MNKVIFFFNTCKYPIFIFIVTRFLIMSIGVLGEVSIPSKSDMLRLGITEDPLNFSYQTNIFIDILTRWDGGQYLAIVLRGYHYVLDKQSTVVFFPFYPMLISISTLFRADPVVFGVLMSNSAFLVALIIYYLLTKETFTEKIARRAVLYLAIFPTSIYYSALYTESTYLLFSLSVFYFLIHKRYGIAAFFGCLASATRLTGILLYPTALLYVFQNIQMPHGTFPSILVWLKRHWYILFCLSCIPIGLFGYMIYLHFTFGDAWAFIHAQKSWGMNVESIGGVVYHLSVNGLAFLAHPSYSNYFDIVNFLSLILFVGVLSTIFRFMGFPYFFYALMAIVFPLSVRSASFIRYTMVLFPMFTALAIFAKTEWFHTAIVITFSLLCAYITILFVNGFWIA